MVADLVLTQCIGLIFQHFFTIQEVVRDVTILGGISQQLTNRTLAFKARLHMLYESPTSYSHLTAAVKDLEVTITDVLDFLKKLSETGKWRLMIVHRSLIDEYQQLQKRLDRCRDDLHFEMAINQTHENHAFEDDLQDILTSFLKEQQTEVKQVMAELVKNLTDKNFGSSPVMEKARLILDPKNAGKDPNQVLDDQWEEDMRRLKMDQKRLEKSDDKIGSGGFGDIYRGFYNKSVVALKCLRQERNLTLDDDKIKDLLEEVRLQSKCSFKHVAHVYGFWHADSTVFAVMEYAPSGSLGNLLNYATGRSGQLSIPGHESTVIPVNVVLMLLYETALGIEFIHSQCIIHRDIKPSNILLDASLTPKLTDFGLAKDLTDIDMQSHTCNIGSTYYMAPEVLQYMHGISSKARYTYTADVYSFGAVIVELCHRLYGEGRQRKLVPKDLPLPKVFQSTLCTLKDRCVDQIPNSRFGRGSDDGASMEPLLKDILDAIGGSPRDSNGESQIDFFKLCAAAKTTGALCSDQVSTENYKNSLPSSGTASTINTMNSDSSSSAYTSSLSSSSSRTAGKPQPFIPCDGKPETKDISDVPNTAGNTKYNLNFFPVKEEEEDIHLPETSSMEANGSTRSKIPAFDVIQEAIRSVKQSIMNKKNSKIVSHKEDNLDLEAQDIENEMHMLGLQTPSSTEAHGRDGNTSSTEVNTNTSTENTTLAKRAKDFVMRYRKVLLAALSVFVVVIVVIVVIVSTKNRCDPYVQYC